MASFPQDKDTDEIEFLGDVDMFDEAPRDSFNLDPIDAPWQFMPAAAKPRLQVVIAILMVVAMVAVAFALL